MSIAIQNIRSSDIDTRKLATYLHATSRTSTMLDILVICELLDGHDLSPTDIQQLIYGKRRGGSVDRALSRLEKQGLILLTNCGQQATRKLVNWTLDGQDLLKRLLIKTK